MQRINPDKGFIQIAAKRRKVEAGSSIPTDWLVKLGNLIADDILKMDANTKSEFINDLDKKAGDRSTYTFKASLHESMQTLYSVLADATTPFDQKRALADKIVEGVAKCVPGFENRCNECIESLTQVGNLDEMLSVIRQSIVSNVASQAIVTYKNKDPDGINEPHTYNRFFVIAITMGYGVRPLNPNDIYQGVLSDQIIEHKLKKAFASHYTLFNILNSVMDQLQSLTRSFGYQGRINEGYDYKKFSDLYDKYGCSFLKPFIGDFPAEKLWVVKEGTEDDDVPVNLDINWVEIKKALLNHLRINDYFRFTVGEEKLLEGMAGHPASLSDMPTEAISTLFPNDDELVFGLQFYSECSAETKAALVLAYLKGKSEEEQNTVIKKLERIPSLSKDLQFVPAMKPVYSAYLQSELLIAVKEDKFDKVKSLIARGADVNVVLGDLMVNHKAAIMSDPNMRRTINKTGLSATIPAGKNKGKTVAESWVNSKRGRYCLLQDLPLQGLFPDMIAGQSKASWLMQAEKEKPVQSARLFVPENPRVTQFLQHVVYGEKKEAEEMLKAHPEMRQVLLTGKAKVKDHAGRKIKGTALQIALGAKDVSIGPHEEMAEMLERYLNQLPDGKTEITKQIAEQFPAGWEQQEEARKKADSAALKRVFERIQASTNDADGEAAVKEFKAYLARQKDGVIKTGFHFNEQLFKEAMALCEDNYINFGGFGSKKNRLAAIKVIGGIEWLFTNNLAQAACDGISKIMEKKATLSRSLKLDYPAGLPFFHLDLGSAHYVYTEAGFALTNDGNYGAAIFSKFMSRKNINLAKLMQIEQRRHRAPSTCTMM